MLYFDGVHLVADTLQELHKFCELMDIKRCWFEGINKQHPHYDIVGKNKSKIKEGNPNIKFTNSKEVLMISKRSYLYSLGK